MEIIKRLKIKFLEGFLFPVFVSVFKGISQKVATSMLGIRITCYMEKLELMWMKRYNPASLNVK